MQITELNKDFIVTVLANFFVKIHTKMNIYLTEMYEKVNIQLSY